MRLYILTPSRATASYRVRWGRLRPALEAAGIATEVAEIPRGGMARRHALRKAREADLVVLQKRLLRGADWRRLRRHAQRLVYDFDDAVCYRPVPPFRSRMRERRFFRAVAESDLVLAGNRVLAGLARLRARRVHVVPSTVEVPVPAPGAVDRLERFTAVWIGQRATLPHLETVLAPILEAGFAVRVIADEAPAGCEFVPWSAEGEQRALEEGHVGLMPLPSNRFTRGKCGYKLLQYYAAGLPAIASPVGVNRVLADGGAFLAREASEWVAALRLLRDDPAMSLRLGERGRGFVARRYSPGAAAERLVRLLRALV